MLFELVSLGVITFLLHLLFKSWSNRNNKYWKQYGVTQLDASSAATNFEVFLGRKDITERDGVAYKYLSQSGEKFCGLIEASNKILVVKDVELIKKILIKDFEYFPNRRDFFAWAHEDHILRKMMLSRTGEEWKDLRNTLSPTFTTGKIRKMMECFNTVGKEWAAVLKTRAKASSGSLKIDVVKCVNQYTVDVIAAAAFGFKAGTVQNPDSEFATMAYRFANFNMIKVTLGMFFPKVMKTLGINVMDEKALAWFEKILNQGLQHRLKSDVRTNDFLQLLADAKKGELKAVEEDELNDFEKEAMGHLKTGKKLLLEDDMLNAQSLLFFLAGFSTTTNFIAFSLYALAAHPDIQKKLREEVDKYAKGEGDFDYDELAQMPYMDMFVSEVLRKFPAALRLERICAKDYKDAETGLTVPKGTFVVVPVNSMHNDAEYYQNPDKFDPEGNFSHDQKSQRSPYTYLPFGSGPRNCIGMRFALIEGKAAVAHVVHSFLIEPTDKTPLPMAGKPGGLQLLPPQDLEIKLTPRKK